MATGTHICQFSLPTQVGHQGSRMVVERLPAYSVGGMGVRVVAPAENARVWEVFGEEVSEPVDAVFRRPCSLSVAVEPMQCDDATVVSKLRRSGDIDNGTKHFVHVHTRRSDPAPQRQPRGLAGAPPPHPGSFCRCGAAPGIIPASSDRPSGRISKPCYCCRCIEARGSMFERIAACRTGISSARRRLQIVDFLWRRLSWRFGAVILGAAELDPASSARGSTKCQVGQRLRQPLHH